MKTNSIQTQEKETDPGFQFLLAGKKLQSHAIVHLLVSSSFGLNAIFYAAWLGYSIGIWALLIQLSWSISFLLLLPVAKRFSNIISLHDFLGQQFGRTTKLIAGICSLVGINYFVIWELTIDKATIAPFLVLPASLLNASPDFLATFVISIFAVLTILHTLLFGIRGNAKTNKLLNVIKIAILFILSWMTLNNFVRLPHELIYKAIFPAYSSVLINIGLMGLCTNIFLNLVWQFVDNSSWQTIIAGAKSSNCSSKRNLKQSSLLIFFLVNLPSTILGISLAGYGGITPDNIFSTIANIVPQYSVLLSCMVVILAVSSMISLIDGMLLASVLTLSVDILPSKFLLGLTPQKRLRLIKILCIICGIVSVWGSRSILHTLRVNTFDFVYIVIISQLSLLGPVLVGLFTKPKKEVSMWLAISVALIVGFGSAIIGSMTGNRIFIDGAGVFTALISVLIAYGARILQQFKSLRDTSV